MMTDLIDLSMSDDDDESNKSTGTRSEPSENQDAPLGESDGKVKVKSNSNNGNSNNNNKRREMEEEEKKTESSPPSPPNKKQAFSGRRHDTNGGCSVTPARAMMDLKFLLDQLKAGVDRQPMGILQATYADRRRMCDWSVLKKTLENDGNYYKKIMDWPTVILAATSLDSSLDRAVGCFLGMVVGDSVGAPLEFTAACSLPLEQRQPKRGDAYAYVKWIEGEEGDGEEGQLKYRNPKNAFALKRGQWTDDASMGICMAESMLACGAYQGGDVRVRFYNWWFFGYCNAFRHDLERQGSVGLGGNISQSLKDLMWNYMGKAATSIPGRYEATGEDAGNGSLMRLAPVPIRYHSSVKDAMNMSEESSYATHPGPDAANCCRFVAFFICRAMHRTTDSKTGIASFTDHVITEFLKLEAEQQQEQHNIFANSKTSSTNATAAAANWLPDFLKPANDDDNNNSSNPTSQTNSTKLRSLLQSKPPSPKEACWNWKASRLAIEETLMNRGHNYNGYPVSAEYFGSYCMDGLSMALWALVHSTGLTDCILKTVNLQGDADTTASIAGQLAGAYYGYQSLLADSCGKRIIQDVRRWDPLMELELRAILLHRDGCCCTTTAAAAAAGADANEL